MTRKLEFEGKIYKPRACLTTAAARGKLAALGTKIGLVQWGQLGRGERLMI
jgi:hypothetical protein